MEALIASMPTSASFAPPTPEPAPALLANLEHIKKRLQERLANIRKAATELHGKSLVSRIEHEDMRKYTLYIRLEDLEPMDTKTEKQLVSLLQKEPLSFPRVSIATIPPMFLTGAERFDLRYKPGPKGNHYKSDSQQDSQQDIRVLAIFLTRLADDQQ